jgi:hypothetical protein
MTPLSLQTDQHGWLDPEAIIRTLEADLIIITEWLRNNKHVLNAKKSQAIYMHWMYEKY